MKRSTMDQVIALAGILQACKCVDELATHGVDTTRGFDASLKSLFAFDPPSTKDIFGGVEGVETGLSLLIDILNGNYRGVNQNILRYSVGALTLQKKLQADDAMLATIRNRLEHTAFRLDHFTSHRDEIASSIAAIYRDTLSTFGFRIQVTGNMQYLKQEQVSDHVRVALFAAVRAALLWDQLGGSRWQLLWRRKRLIATAENLLQGIS